MQNIIQKPKHLRKNTKYYTRFKIDKKYNKELIYIYG